MGSATCALHSPIPSVTSGRARDSRYHKSRNLAHLGPMGACQVAVYLALFLTLLPLHSEAAWNALNEVPLESSTLPETTSAPLLMQDSGPKSFVVSDRNGGQLIDGLEDFKPEADKFAEPVGSETSRELESDQGNEGTVTTDESGTSPGVKSDSKISTPQMVQGSDPELQKPPGKSQSQPAARALFEAANQDGAPHVWQLTYTQKGRHPRDLQQLDYGRHGRLPRGRHLGRRASSGPPPRRPPPPPPPKRTLDVKGNVFPLGLYRVDILLGQPASTHSVVLDTGSNLLWVQCAAPCVNCPQGGHPPFKPTNSIYVSCNSGLCSQAQNGNIQDCNFGSSKCEYHYGYFSGMDTHGYLIQDTVRLPLANGSAASVPLVFGCGFDNPRTLIKPGGVDGVLGLGRESLSIPSQLSTMGVPSVFGHCLGGETEGGYFFLGDALVPRWGVQWTPIVGAELKLDTQHYYVQLQSMFINGNKLNLPSEALTLVVDPIYDTAQGGFLFDSGATFTYFTTEVYTPFLARLRHIMRKRMLNNTSVPTPPFATCWSHPTGRAFRSLGEASSFFPTVYLNFQGAQLVWNAGSYLAMDHAGSACLAIYNNGPVEFGARNIVGDVSMRSHLFIYDNVKDRVGWTRRDCGQAPT